MTDAQALDRLARLAGIEPFYHDIWGNDHPLGDDNKRILLGAMGIAVGNEAETAASLAALESKPWRRALEPVEVVRDADAARPAISLRLRADRLDSPIAWHLLCEAGDEFSGTVRPRDLPLTDETTLDGLHLERRRFVLTLDPGSVPLGYHRISVAGDGLAGALGDETTLIVAPDSAWLPPRLEQGKGSWGFALQLYALEGGGSWGMGDFRDLASFAAAAAQLGADIVGVNPLHALFLGNPLQASPYSPSSRRFLNPLYIDISAVPDFADCPELAGRFDTELAALREVRHIDYAGVATAKLSALEILHRSFRLKHLAPGDPRGDDFHAFLRAGGADLERFAVFAALDEFFRENRLGYFPWQDWPAPYRDPDSPDVAAFAGAHRGRIAFHQFLQWEADRQLGRAADAAREGGMRIGLYRDLAVGIDGAGAEAWLDQKVFARGISTGAPPDPFNMKGQSWGLPPFRPDALRDEAYRPFITVLRANMRHAGALRIDHVMGLTRLFWVPQVADARSGGYVRYPLDDLLAILALESRRARCLVVGEDLGTVPEGLRDRLAAANILSTRLLYFENDDNHFRPAERYPKLAQVAIGSQDLPTFAGFWHERDLDLRAALDLFPTETGEAEARADRARARHGLLDLFRREGLIQPGGEGDVTTLAAAAYRLLAASPARLVTLYPEDLLGSEDQTNLPGTVDQYPNWRTKLPQEWQTILADPRVIAMARALALLRPH
ncbi:MAG: 4-alpha-glucanotransferase [Stellaceae bacterium]